MLIFSTLVFKSSLNGGFAKNLAQSNTLLWSFHRLRKSNYLFEYSLFCGYYVLCIMFFKSWFRLRMSFLKLYTFFPILILKHYEFTKFKFTLCFILANLNISIHCFSWTVTLRYSWWYNWFVSQVWITHSPPTILKYIIAYSILIQNIHLYSV